MNFSRHGVFPAAVALCSVVFVSPTLAAEPGWSGKAGLGYLATSGNSDTVNVNGNVQAAYVTGKWAYSGAALATGAESGGDSTAERYKVSGKAQYDFTDHDYVFAKLSWEKDKFSGVAQQTSESVGYGRRLLNTDVHVLNAEAGVGFRQQDFLDGSSESGAVARVGGDYRFNLSKTAYFTQELDIVSGADNTTIESISAVSAKLRDALALVLSYTVKNNSDVPAGSEKTDTFTAISLEYGF